MKNFNPFKNIIAQLNNAIKLQQTIINVLVTKDSLELLSFLASRGFISHYQLCEEVEMVKTGNNINFYRAVVVFKVIDNQNFISKFSILPASLSRKLIDLQEVKKRCSMVIVVRTTIGYLTLEECCLLGLGGSPTFLIMV